MSSINTSLPEGRAPRMSHMMSANEGPMDSKYSLFRAR